MDAYPSVFGTLCGGGVATDEHMEKISSLVAARCRTILLWALIGKFLLTSYIFLSKKHILRVQTGSDYLLFTHYRYVFFKFLV